MQPYSAAKQWRDGFGANETRITAADLTHIEDGISAATQGVTNLETKVNGQPAEIMKQVQSIAEGIKTLVNKVTPIGTIMMYGAERDPEGWMRCDGRLLDRNTYANLYSVIGLTYGSTTVSNFRIPDIRERSVVGTGPGSKYDIGNKGGNTTITLSINQMPAHTHEIGESEDPGRRFQSRTAGQDIGIGSSGYTYLTSTGNNAGGRSPIATSVGGSQPIDLRDPYFGLPYILRVS